MTAEPSVDDQQAVAVPRRKAVRMSRPMRLLGNLLIVAGVLMLFGIGGWYAYTQWDNQQYEQRLIQKFGPASVNPPVQAAAPEPTATAQAPAPLPVLYNKDIVKGMLGIANKLPTQKDDSPPVRLVIPSVRIDSPVVPVTWNMIPSKNGGSKSEWQVANYAVGHHYGSANPGEVGNVVMSGHVDYKGQVFKDLHLANKGDEVIVYTEKGQYLYVITDMVLVLEDGAPPEAKARNAAYMNPTPDQTLTMITCWPYGIDDHRLIAIAKPYQSTLSTQSEFFIR